MKVDLSWRRGAMQPLPTLSPGRNWTHKKAHGQTHSRLTASMTFFRDRVWKTKPVSQSWILRPRVCSALSCACQGAVASLAAAAETPGAQASIRPTCAAAPPSAGVGALARGGARAGLHPPGSQDRHLQGRGIFPSKDPQTLALSQPAALPASFSQADPPVAVQGVHVVPSWE